MNLPVLDAESSNQPWYGQGLKFTCSQCGNCCTGGPGFVWLSEAEIVRLAEFLKITPEEVVEKYCRKIAGRFSLDETRNSIGEYDCVFLKEQKVRDESGTGVTQTRRTCSIYPVRPLQCRTWPFWDGVLTSKTAWDRAAKRCHGMNNGRSFTLKQIEALRTAEDWPQNPPTSSGK